MSPLETLILTAYFFVLIILAVYGWHRYYLVYLYMKYRDKEREHELRNLIRELRPYHA